MRKLVVSMLAPALASILGCIDATPSDFSVPDAGAGGQPDVDYSDLPADAIPPGPIEVCRACLGAPEDPGPGCATGYDPCMAHEQCSKILACVLEKGCFAAPTLSESNICSFPCFVSNGVSTLDDPVIAIASPVGNCAYGICRPACGVAP